MKNWKTTVAGIGAMASAIGPALIALSNGDWNVMAAALPGIFAGLVGVFAKDNNVTGGSVPQ